MYNELISKMVPVGIAKNQFWIAVIMSSLIYENNDAFDFFFAKLDTLGDREPLN